MTRLERARRKVRVAQAAIGIGAATGLAVFAGLARSSHPATHPARAPGVSTQRSGERDADDDSFFRDDDSDSSSYLGPSGSAAPQIESGAS